MPPTVHVSGVETVPVMPKAMLSAVPTVALAGLGCGVAPEDATSSDAEFLYFEWPYLATKEKMFFKVGAGNAFGETK